MLRRRFPALLSTAAIATLAVVAAAGLAPAGAQTEPEAGTDDPTVAIPKVKVLDAGDAPRTELRYTVPAGTTQTVELRTYSRISQTQNGQTRSGSTPNVRFTIDAVVNSVAADGNRSVTYEYAAIDVSDSGPSDVAEQTREALEPLIGVSGTMTMTPTGAVLANDVVVPEGLDPTAEQLFDQLSSQASTLSIPFPEEKVGEGARWRATTSTELSGIQFEQTVTFTLARGRGGELSLDIEIRQRAPRQDFVPPGTDTEITMLSSRGTGSGDTVLDPAIGVLPVGGTTNIKIRQRLSQGDERLTQSTQTSLFVNEDR